MPFLDGSRLKLDRAGEHLRVLETQMRKELDAKERTIVRETETKIAEGSTETRFGEVRLSDPPVLPPEWSLLIGDFVANARAALDHLAYQLVLDNTWTPRRPKKNGKRFAKWPPKDTEFPIFAKRPDPRDPRRDKRLENRLSYFRPKPRRVIEGLQPYKRGLLAKAEPLWMLKELRDADTHRTLHTVLASVPSNELWQLYRPVRTSSGGTAFYQPEELKKLGLDLAVGDIVKTTMMVKANFSPYVTFDQRGAVFHGQEVLPLLHRCKDEVERILGLFAT